MREAHIGDLDTCCGSHDLYKTGRVTPNFTTRYVTSLFSDLITNGCMIDKVLFRVLAKKITLAQQLSE